MISGCFFISVGSVSFAIRLDVEVLGVEAIGKLNVVGGTLSMSSVIWNYWAIGVVLILLSDKSNETINLLEQLITECC